jgi:hypothetical protein
MSENSLQIMVEYIGEDTEHYMIDGDGNKFPMSEEDIYWQNHEFHELRYADHSVVITTYECCSAAFLLNPFKGNNKGNPIKGICLGGHLHRHGEWKISEDSLKEIEKHLKEKAVE